MRIRWLSLLFILAVLAVNIAGIWQIASARRSIREQAERIFEVKTLSRANDIESLLDATRADLAFVARSAPFEGIEAALASRDPREARWRRNAVEGALLLYLRGHPQVARVALLGSDGGPLLQAGRRGGAPVLWKPGEREAVPAGGGPAPQALTTEFPIPAESGRPPGKVVAALEGRILLPHGRAEIEAGRDCRIEDGTGRTILREGPPGGESTGETRFSAAAVVRSEGWPEPPPWKLICEQGGAPAEEIIEPLAAKWRASVALNVGVMVLAIALGVFSMHQVRTRERVEAKAREEARVHELEQRLFHSERLSTVGRLAAGMAHEINNPLEGIGNYLMLCREALTREDAGAVRRYLDGAVLGVERAAGVVRQVLAQADPARGALAPVDLGEIVSQSIAFVRSRREFSKIRFVAQPADGHSATVQGNAVMLGQVLLNLLLNACEAQPDGGEIAVGSSLEGGAVSVEVADRGPGLPSGAENRVFEPFYSTKSSTGLGLSISSTIVRQHGGTLEAWNRPGGGAVFRLSLPLLPDAARETGGVTAQQPRSDR